MARRSTNLSLPELAAEVENLKAMLGKVSARPTFPATQANIRTIRQTGHGFSTGNPVRHNGTTWVKSKADTAANAVVDGIVLTSLNADAFLIAFPGSYIAGLSGLTAGAVHYLDASTAGALTTTAPAIAVPVIHADSTTSGMVLDRLAIVEDAEYITTLTSGATYSIPTGRQWLRFVPVGAGGGAGGGRSWVNAGLWVASSSGGSPTVQLRAWAEGGSGASGGALIIDAYVGDLASVSTTFGAAGADGSAGSNGGAGGDTTITIGSTTFTAKGGPGGVGASLVGSLVGPGTGAGGANQAIPALAANSRFRSVIALNGRNGESGSAGLDASGYGGITANQGQGGRAPFSIATGNTYGDGSRYLPGGFSAQPGAIYVFNLRR